MTEKNTLELDELAAALLDHIRVSEKQNRMRVSELAFDYMDSMGADYKARGMTREYIAEPPMSREQALRFCLIFILGVLVLDHDPVEAYSDAKGAATDYGRTDPETIEAVKGVADTLNQGTKVMLERMGLSDEPF